MPIATTKRAEVPEAVRCGKTGVTTVTEFSSDAAPGNLEQLYTLYNSRVYYLCLHMTGNVEDAEDLSQEAFLRMMQKLDSFRGESAFYTWLRRLAVNVVLLRFQKASFRREVSLEEMTEIDNRFERRSQRAFATLDLGLAGALDRISLERAIERLAPGLKAVFILHDIEGYEHTEIANLLGCTVGTSKSQLHKARLRMRDLLGESWRERATQTAERAEAARAPISFEKISNTPTSSPDDLVLSSAAFRQRLAA